MLGPSVSDQCLHHDCVRDYGREMHVLFFPDRLWNGGDRSCGGEKEEMKLLRGDVLCHLAFSLETFPVNPPRKVLGIRRRDQTRDSWGISTRGPGRSVWMTAG